MEEDIKMLEKLCNQIIDEDDLDMFEILSPYEIAQAIKNLLTRYKELEEKNKTQLEAFELGKESSRKRIEYDYIPKSKVKEKIEELDKEEKRELKGTKGQDRYYIKQKYMYKRKVLEELLREE